jgi:hypothetical protein
VIIRQLVDDSREGNEVLVRRVLRVENRLYVDVWQTVDATEPTLMRAVNRAVDTFMLRTKLGRGYGTQEGNGCI